MQCPAGLSPRIILHYPLKISGKPWRWEKIQVISKKITHLHHQKNHYHSFLSVIPSPIKQQCSSNHPIQVWFLLAVITVVSCLLTSGIMYKHVTLILNDQCLLKVFFSMRKTLNGQSSPKKNFLFSPPLNAIWKTQLLLMVFFLFFTLPF